MACSDWSVQVWILDLLIPSISFCCKHVLEDPETLSISFVWYTALQRYLTKKRFVALHKALHDDDSRADWRKVLCETNNTMWHFLFQHHDQWNNYHYATDSYRKMLFWGILSRWIMLKSATESQVKALALCNYGLVSLRQFF